MTATKNASPANGSLLSRGMIAVLLAQFLSAAADNALLFGAIALLKAHTYPDWSIPVLQEFFVGAYIVLAPFAGPFADSLPKGRVMLIANALKLLGALGMSVGVNPFVAYGMVGIGAAAYSPAKYGILSELTSPEKLVKANGLMESSTIAAILLGAIAGGTGADRSITGTLTAITICYGLAAAVNLLIPRLPPEHPLGALSLRTLLRDFVAALGKLFRNGDARFSIAGTSLFWGAGSTLRFLLVAWVPIALGIAGNSMPAYMNAMVAVGIVVGAAAASQFVTLDTVNRVLPGGVLIGVCILALSLVSNVNLAFVVLAAAGACGGYFVVPLNALLQERGHETVGAGHAIAIQNLAENAAMLVMIGVYVSCTKAGVPVTSLAQGFGLLLALAVGALWIVRVRAAHSTYPSA